MNMLNNYYKTRFSLDTKDDYLKADLRMQTLISSALGKNKFEAIAFVISSVNGCPYCVNSHEKSLKQHRFSTDQIHELIRLASIVKAISVLDQL
jgi:alkyl hydroperoxide reductase subunit D